MAYTTINKSTDYFNTVLYTGDGNATQAITNTFQTDFSWIKDRGVTAAHTLQDAVRTWDVTKKLTSNDNDAENNASGATWGNYGGVTAVGATSFTTSLGSNTPYQTNANGSNYVSWNWKVAGTSGSANSDGSVASTVSVNTTAGFSIVKWTGTGATATVGHGLGAKPSIVLIKNTGATENWVMYHSSLTAEKNLKLNNQEAAQDTTGAFNDTEPTSSVFTVHTNTNTNQNGQVMIAYCFAEKTGYSKFGKYTGNNNANGTFIYTGFKPAIFITKRDTAGYDWIMYTNKINGANLMNDYLNPNANSAETVNNANQVLDILSNGIKHRGTGASTNGSADFYYLAFGQSLVGSNNVPCTAR